MVLHWRRCGSCLLYTSQTGRVYISSQNHGYVVDEDKIDPNVAVPAFKNVNDGTNEGLAYAGKNIFTVQLDVYKRQVEYY